MGDTGFKHIAVTAAEEDDFVIHAGVVDDASEAEAVVVEPEPEVAPTPEPEPAPVQQQAPTKPSDQRKPAPKKADTYRQTTLEDLEGKPMPLTQKIVIAAAIVCIIGAVIYYFVFMG